MQDKNLTLLVRKRIFLKLLNFKENIFIDKNPLNSKFQFQTYYFLQIKFTFKYINNAHNHL